MKKLTNLNWAFLFAVLVTLVLSCDSQAQKQSNPEEEILQVNKVLLDSNQHIIKVNALKFVRLTQAFIGEKADSSKVIKYAIQGAEVAVNIGEYQKAIQSYDLLIKQFPNHPKLVANALFAKAFVLENNMKDIEGARKIYQSILDKYPNQEIAKTIPATLQNLGKSEAELLKMLKNKNK